MLIYGEIDTQNFADLHLITCDPLAHLSILYAHLHVHMLISMYSKYVCSTLIMCLISALVQAMYADIYKTFNKPLSGRLGWPGSPYRAGGAAFPRWSFSGPTPFGVGWSSVGIHM
ncbi:hypothetical protein AVEN_10493-1 [Araneus ventricosus]|uniref:Uncharacterized protein n=1 Tax=Araneus ventricosus TaxID=182803 RepID=A0A4Y2MX26_ARAVE|nr:hypothetical protein AVEN_10493-1 [Araneus ventricosus]